MPTDQPLKQHFIRRIIEEDLSTHKIEQLVTRFPPEPNGYLHIGHAKSICLNFGLAQDYQGVCYLRFDDTNPEKEDIRYMHAIEEDITWLGFQWTGQPRYASDYFQFFFQQAIYLIETGFAFVCHLCAEEIRETRGTLQTPGIDSPYRNRSIEENLDLFTRMRAGEFADGECVLRAKIDMGSGNVNLRDPVLYRIRHSAHPRTGNTWCVYPTYDYAHSLSDAREGITHSLCTLEFQDHRPLYDWCISHTQCQSQPRQYEFARLNLSHTITSKRKLMQLVDAQHVTGWDDPRLPTLAGLRQRGVPAKAIRRFCEEIGISKSDSCLDIALLEETIRDELNQSAARAMVVTDPIRLIITNCPEDHAPLVVPNHPQNSAFGERTMRFDAELFIERQDFHENPPKKYHRLAPGKEVRLRHAYVIQCHGFDKDDAGHVTTVYCTMDKATLGKKPEGRKVKGVIHWVAASTALNCTLLDYDRLFHAAQPDVDNAACFNAKSLSVITGAKAETSLGQHPKGATFQFERQGYYHLQRKEADVWVYNRIVSLRDTWQNT